MSQISLSLRTAFAILSVSALSSSAFAADPFPAQLALKGGVLALECDLNDPCAFKTDIPLTATTLNIQSVAATPNNGAHREGSIDLSQALPSGIVGKLSFSLYQEDGAKGGLFSLYASAMDPSDGQPICSATELKSYDGSPDQAGFSLNVIVQCVAKGKRVVVYSHVETP